MNIDLDSLIMHLGHDARTVLENSSISCVTRGGYEITIEDYLLELLALPDNEFSNILEHFCVSQVEVVRALQNTQDLRSGNTSHPVFSPLFIDWLQESWLLSSLKMKLSYIPIGIMILALLMNPNRFGRMRYFELFSNISLEQLSQIMEDRLVNSDDEAYLNEQSKSSIDNALSRFTIDFTEMAKKGDIDPVFCRDDEIHLMIDILARRRKNNPIVVGEPGVGKTAVVEGLALKIVKDEVPDILKNIKLLGLDMGLLQAGASVKGEFEKRLKAVIEEVKSSEIEIILFIDEAHTLVGAGQQAGGNDAANLLKPALARGELRTIAATTWSEYKKYFEKDPALARRFQLIKLDEPSPEQAIVILRGLKEKYETNHGVYITDEAIQTAARLSERYISGRLLPDKAIDVIDTACARVKISISSKPKQLFQSNSRIKILERELKSVLRDFEVSGNQNHESIIKLQDELIVLNRQYGVMNQQWKDEAFVTKEILEVRDNIIKNIAYNDSDKKNQGLIEKLKSLLLKLNSLIDSSDIKENALISYEVDSQLIGKVISDWTGIPMTHMINDNKNWKSFSKSMLERIKGQEHAIKIIDDSVKAANAGLSRQDAPDGVFLLVGPSGVGKTETAIAMADLLYGGERFLTTINMSEFQEKHSVSRLIGSPPGYVGYGEGGVLTEAIRKRPYSVVLLDEIEKADPEVMNLFYQVFDKGVLNDGEGREVDFKNTIIILTSNIASDIISKHHNTEEKLQWQKIVETIRPELNQLFKPALLSRMTIIPYYPVHGRVMAELTEVKLDRIARRIKDEYKIQLKYDHDVLQQIVKDCSQFDTGARNIDHVINHTIIPKISTKLLSQFGPTIDIDSLTIMVNKSGVYEYQLA